MKLKFLFIIGLTFGLTASTNAIAHTGLISCNPKSGSLLTKLPAKIILKFYGNLITVAEKEVNKVTILGPNGSFSFGKPQIKGNQISLATNGSSDSGSYQIKWRVVSEDGHPISGSFKFRVR